MTITSESRWGAIQLPDTMCPMPPAHTYATAKAAYKAAQKANPGLTPAAWRKAAAQEMGLDYSTYLKLWKEKPKFPVVAESSPTLPATSAVGPDMGLVAKKPDIPSEKSLMTGGVKPPTSVKVKSILEKQYIHKQGYTKVKTTHTGQVYGGGAKFIPGWKDMVKVSGDTIEVTFTTGLDAFKLKAAGKKLADEGWYVKQDGMTFRISKNPIDGADYNPLGTGMVTGDEAFNAIIKAIQHAGDGTIANADLHSILDSIMAKAKVKPGGPAHYTLKTKIKHAKADFPLSHVDEVKASVAKPTEWHPNTFSGPGQSAAEVGEALTAKKITYEQAMKWFDLLDDSTSLASEAEFIQRLKSNVTAMYNKTKVGAEKAWKPQFNPSYDRLHEIEDAFNNGLITKQETLKWLDTMGEGKVSYYVKGAMEEYKAALINPLESVAADVIETQFGPLTHVLAKDAYKHVKIWNPGATPAALRKAAADYLNVSYKDYLKAWKKPTSVADNLKTTPLDKLPPPTEPILSKSTVNKYEEADVSADTLKDELAKLFGPGANQAYINVTVTPNGTLIPGWVTTFPKSLIKTKAAEDAIVKGLEHLGLMVRKLGAKSEMTYKITNLSISETLAGKVNTIAKAVINPTGDPISISKQGYSMWHKDHADIWSRKWWEELPIEQQRAVRAYTGNGYHTINAGLRGRETISSGDKVVTKHLSAAMRPIPDEMTLFRGSQASISEFKVGELWEDKGFHSTAIHSDGGFYTSARTKFHITVPKGTKGAYVDPNSSHRGEHEVILDKGTKFRVISVVGNVVHMIAIAH